MDIRYYLFGLNISSAIALPAHPIPCSHQAATDVVIEYGQTPAVLANPLIKGVRFQASPGEFLLRVDNVARFYVKDGNHITIMPEAGTDNDNILIFLMGSAMGALLHQRKILVLHAGAIVNTGKCAVFSGPSGVGKSTLVAGLHQRGYPFLADDVCAVMAYKGRPAVIPEFPRLKLWNDVLRKMNIDMNGLKSVRWNKGLEKYFYPIESIQSSPVPLQSVFVMGTANTENLEIIALKGNEKVDPLIANTYRRRFLEGLGVKMDHFTQCAAVAAKADVYRIVRPNKGFLLNELIDLVEASFLL